MRFHHLTVTAFGPFAATQAIDFEELNDAGIFLLTGPTGAGKTSVLDAVCFALYGVVPGQRGVKALRSHHAGPDIQPRVVLEVTLAGRRFRIERSPEWHRPKKRGEGTTKENASASLVELTDGSERLVSARIQEVGHELAPLLGMRSEQFMQVVMLPQGDFQTFLRASSDERQGVLERLFQTGRFAQVEDWMRDRTRQLAVASEAGEKRVSQLLATISHRSRCPLPDELSSDRLGDVSQAARSWVSSVSELVERSRDMVRDAEAAALEELELAEDAAAEAARLASVAKRRQEAQRVLVELDRTEAASAVDAASLATHERALLVKPYLEPLRALERERSAAVRRCDDAGTKVRDLPEALRPASIDPAACDAAFSEVTGRIALLRAVLPREQALDRQQRELTEARTDVERLHTLAAAAATERERLPGRRRELTARMVTAQATASGLDAAGAALAAAVQREEAARAVPEALAA